MTRFRCSPIIVLVAGLSFGTTAHAARLPGSVRVSANCEPTQAAPGDVVTLAVTIELPEQWVAYDAEQVSNSVAPTRIHLDESVGLLPLETFTSTGALEKPDSLFNQRVVRYFQTSPTFRRPILLHEQIEPGDATVTGSITFQVCNERNGRCYIVRNHRFSATVQIRASQPAELRTTVAKPNAADAKTESTPDAENLPSVVDPAPLVPSDDSSSNVLAKAIAPVLITPLAPATPDRRPASGSDTYDDGIAHGPSSVDASFDPTPALPIIKSPKQQPVAVKPEAPAAIATVERASSSIEETSDSVATVANVQSSTQEQPAETLPFGDDGAAASKQAAHGLTQPVVIELTLGDCIEEYYPGTPHRRPLPRLLRRPWQLALMVGVGLSLIAGLAAMWHRCR